MAYVALQAETVDAAVEEAVREFVAGVIGAIPRVVAGAIFLALAYVGIRAVRSVARFVLERAYPPEQGAIVDLGLAILSLFLWFGAALALFNVLGLSEIAASLGTASGFVALGVAYALSDMIADTVAGVYLLQDPDFNPGDRVSTGDVAGTVASIGLRKSRIETDDGDRVVLANQDVDVQWTLEGGREPDAPDATVEVAGTDESADSGTTDESGATGESETTDDSGE